MTAFNPLAALRSPRETLDGYIILPRLIDKVRVQARGELPAAYQRNLLHRPGFLLHKFQSLHWLLRMLLHVLNR